MLNTEFKKLNQLRANVISLGNFSINSNAKILKFLEKNNISKLSDIDLTSKQQIQDHADKIDNDTVSILSLYCPEARDLRELISNLKISNELVRVASNTRSFVRDFTNAYKAKLQTKKIYDYLIPMQERSVFALKMCIEMLSLEDEKEVKNHFQQIYTAEKQTDKMFRLLTKEVIKLAEKDSDNSIEYVEILESVRRIERNADRSLSIASLVFYAKIGGEITQEIPVHELN